MERKIWSDIELNDVQGYIEEIFDGEIHAKRIQSLAGATTGVLASGSLAISAIGLGLSHACGTVPKHAVKQVDRLVGNQKVDVWDYFQYWAPHVIGERESIMVALDWTSFDRDGQKTIALNMLTSHGRAIPLIWRTIKNSELKDRQAEYEDSVLERLRETISEKVKVTVVADRGFMDVALFEQLQEKWQFDYIIRLKNNIKVTSFKGECRSAAKWIGANGRAKTLRNVTLTAQQIPVATVVCMKAPEMKESWCLAASDPTASAKELAKYYGKRWSIETYFRDAKDMRFGLGMDSIHTKDPSRRDRLFLLSAFAIVLLTLLGAACEQVGYDRYLKANTVKRRTHSLFRQGQMVYESIPRMREEWLIKIMKAFTELLGQQKVFKQLFSVV